MAVPISSMNHILVVIPIESDFKILERLSSRAKRVELKLLCFIKDIYEPN